MPEAAGGGLLFTALALAESLQKLQIWKCREDRGKEEIG